MSLRKLIIQSGKHALRRVGEFQARHSRVATTPVLANDQFLWVPALEDNWRRIRAELDAVLVHPEDIPAFHQLSPDQQRISKGDNWKTYAFYIFGNRAVIAAIRTSAYVRDPLKNLAAWNARQRRHPRQPDL